MADFTPINSQEEFDALIKDRLERERTAVRKEYADYEDIKTKLSKANEDMKAQAEKLTSFESQISDLNAKLSASETDSAKTRIALETGIPYEMRNRLNGTTEDEIRKDAEELVKFFNTQRRDTDPLYTRDGVAKDAETVALSALSEKLR